MCLRITKKILALIDESRDCYHHSTFSSFTPNSFSKREHVNVTKILIFSSKTRIPDTAVERKILRRITLSMASLDFLARRYRINEMLASTNKLGRCASDSYKFVLYYRRTV